MQIRTRLTLQFIFIVAGILCVVLFYVYFQFKQNLQDEFFGNLRSKALMTAHMVADKLTEPAYLELQHVEPHPLLADTYTENISLYDLSGRRIYSFNPAPGLLNAPTLRQIRRTRELRFSLGRYEAIGMLYANPAGREFVVVAEAVFNQTHLSNLGRILILVFLIAIALVAVGGWFFARQALAPVSQIMNQVDALAATDMSQRLVTTDQQDELSRLVITFNRLLDRIQQAFRVQKMFLSNISHELKNPLNVIISQIEIALHKERPRGEYRQTLESVLSDVQELNEVTDKLMQMARINSDGSAIQFQALRIDEMIWQTKAAFLKSRPDYRVGFEVVNLPALEEKLYVKANEQLLKTALVNLMDNGCKFSPDSHVTVRLAFPDEETPVIEIEDAGPGIGEHELPLVFHAFYRSPPDGRRKRFGHRPDPRRQHYEAAPHRPQRDQLPGYGHDVPPGLPARRTGAGV